MDFSRRSTEQKIKRNTSNGKKYLNKCIIFFFKAALTAVIFAVVFSACAAFGVFMGILDNTPQISIDSIVPLGYATTVYDSEGKVTDTLVMEGSNRAEVTWDELPEDLINAFVAIEDSRFWEHNGIDTRAIFRAIKGVVTGDSSSGGGSTITQQLIKNNVFEGGREKSFGERLERKFQEQYIAIALEKTMDKKLILVNYLNTINLGNNSLGVKVAARRYFDKDVSDLTLSECAVIAGITQNPSKLNPITGKEANAEKRKIILQYMEEQGYITAEEHKEALEDNVYDRIQNVDIVSKEKINTYSYFTDALIEQVMEVFTEDLGYSETQAKNLLYSGGLSIYSTQDPEMQAIVDEEVNNPDNYVTTQYSLEYRLSIKDKYGDTQNYNEKTMKTWQQDNGITHTDLYDSREAAEAAANEYKEGILTIGDEVIGETVTVTLEPQVSFTLMDQRTGYVKAISGGRGTKTTSLSLNRATGTYRQPGSTFKVITAFAPAIEECGATLATTYYDSPYTIGTKTFKNWYSGGYAGWSTIREGIIYSMNIVAVRCLVETVTPERGVEFAKKLGITSLTDTDYNPALALGGITKGVSNIELTGAYAAIANGGKYNKPKFFSKIVDHNGRILVDYTDSESTRVMKATTAWLLTDAMKDSMQYNVNPNIGVSSTSTAARLDNMSCAGKSGTTSNSNDIWFVGYTPYYTAGVWAGYDNNERTLSGQASFHKQIWKNIMNRVHEGLDDIGFTMPASITQETVCRKSGNLPTGYCYSSGQIYTEYFDKNSVPYEACELHYSGGLRTPEGSGETADTAFNALPEPEETEEAEEDEESPEDIENELEIIGPGAHRDAPVPSPTEPSKEPEIGPGLVIETYDF